MEQPIIGRIEQLTNKPTPVAHEKIRAPLDEVTRAEIRKIVREEIGKLIEEREQDENKILNLMRFALSTGEKRVFISGAPNGGWVFKLENCPKDPPETTDKVF